MKADPCKPKIYLAGPDVFFPDAERVYQRLEALCSARGLTGVRPADGSATYKGPAGTAEHGKAIYRENIARIQGCDAVLANLHPFRNAVEPDSRTVFEVGYAVALGLPVAGVVPDHNRPLEHKVLEHFGYGIERNGLVYDKTYDYMVEAFGFPLNLMLACSATMHSSAETALDALKTVLTK